MRFTIMAALAAASVLGLSGCKQVATGGNATENAAAPAAAEAGAIDGTWKADLASVQIEQKPDQLLLQNGQFSCATCTPPLTVAADGAMHAVRERTIAGNSYLNNDDCH
jgi:membrane protein involved in colicin uptake